MSDKLLYLVICSSSAGPHRQPADVCTGRDPEHRARVTSCVHSGFIPGILTRMPEPGESSRHKRAGNLVSKTDFCGKYLKRYL